MSAMSDAERTGSARQPQTVRQSMRTAKGSACESPAYKPRLGVLISGNGSNLQALIDACASGELPATIALVISNKPQAYGLERAKAAGIKALCLAPHAFSAESDPMRSYNVALRDALWAAEVDLVIMAGYMKLLGTEVLDAFPQRVLNLHPALLPAFPGAHAIEEAFKAQVSVTGVTVHIANEHFDEGPILAQVEVPVRAGDTLDTLEARIHEEEHQLLPQTVAEFIRNGGLSESTFSVKHRL